MVTFQLAPFMHIQCAPKPCPENIDSPNSAGSTGRARCGGGSNRHLRKVCCSRSGSHRFQAQPLRKSSQTCFEGPFGEVLRATGPMAKANPFRFSTKYQDDETDFVYYGYRYYNASTGRWLSPDPLEELAFAKGAERMRILRFSAPDLNTYGFVANAAPNGMDVLGAGIFCNCDPPKARVGWTVASYDTRGKPTMDGGIVCASPNIGFTATRTTPNSCQNRLLIPTCLIDCLNYTCLVSYEYVCQYTKSVYTAQWGYFWVTTGNARIAKPCPK